ncbi:MAG TPA: phosphate ABC transporter permease PstA [Caulobacterales bacterium]|nr:phosphate ABC transporter permease PstA [Caulobacterales bacterium]
MSTTFVALNRANYARRKGGSWIMAFLCTMAALLGIVLLGLILYTLLEKGIGGLALSVFTEPMRARGGGLANAMIGTLIQTGLGTLIGTPLGMAAGIYLAEVGRNGRFASVVRFVNDILLSAPSVLVGLFVYQIVVFPMHAFSGLAGSIALALLAMPVIARTTEDIMKLVPDSYREGSIALGARHSTTIGRVIVPAAFGGILTGILLAIARISGETAPLLFTSLGSYAWPTSLTQPMASLPIAIYKDAASPYPELTKLAWAGALIITFAVLLFNVVSRLSHHLVSRGGK